MVAGLEGGRLSDVHHQTDVGDEDLAMVIVWPCLKGSVLDCLMQTSMWLGESDWVPVWCHWKWGGQRGRMGHCNRSPKRTDWERTMYGKKRSTCAWWACDIASGAFVESRKYIMLSYIGLFQKRKIHCNQTTSYCSLFFLVLWTSIYGYLVQKLIPMLNVVWQKNRDTIVASRSICVLS